MFSCSKIEQEQLNTWVSFQSAEQPLLGQFSVSGNSVRARARDRPGFSQAYQAPSRRSRGDPPDARRGNCAAR
ncbi:hypothetical protein EGJ12_21270 [Stutzerimonas stutzeri]|nr:hypothetical protein EGJ12_21270 [Stutzerimonas stutzeri]